MAAQRPDRPLAVRSASGRRWLRPRPDDRERSSGHGVPRRSLRGGGDTARVHDRL